MKKIWQTTKLCVKFKTAKDLMNDLKKLNAFNI